MRTINQTLSAKQHEAATAHQENARLLAEFSHAQAAVRSAHEDTRLLKEKLSELSFAKTTADELVGKVATLQADNLRLEEAVARQVAEFVALGKQHRQIETELAIKQASIEAQREAFDRLAQRLQVDRTDSKKTTKVG